MPTTVRALERYAAGVNAWLAQTSGQRGLAFVVTGLQSGKGGGLGGYDPEPWTPLDTVTFGKLQAWALGGNYDAELFRLLADARLGDPALTDLLVPGLPGRRHRRSRARGTWSAAAGAHGRHVRRAVRAGDRAGQPPSTTGPAAGLARLAAIGDGIGALAGFDTGASALGHPGVGSNNWVVGPAKSATGKALLANDPHLGVQMPSIWYMNALHCRVVSTACPYDVAGVSFPSAPGVVLGHNARIAWGVTNTGPDVQDLFVETPDPANPANYLYKGASVPFETREETIAVAGGDPVTITVRSTVHGPILNDVVPDLADTGALYAFRWTALAETDGALGAFLKIDAASIVRRAPRRLRSYVAPAQNFVYADLDGNIGYQIPGRIPVRPRATTAGGRSTARQATTTGPATSRSTSCPPSTTRPTGSSSPPTTTPSTPTYPYHLGNEWDAGWRATRIRQLLDAAAADGGVTQADLSAIQNDVRLLRADEVIPALLAAAPATADGREVQRLISGWNGACDLDSRGCSAYEVTEWRLLRALFDPWLGTLAPMYVGSDPSRLAVRAAVADAGVAVLGRPGHAGRRRRGTRALPPPSTTRGPSCAARSATRPAGPGRASTPRPSASRRSGKSGIGILEGMFNAGPYGVPGTSDAVNNGNRPWAPGIPTRTSRAPRRARSSTRSR